MKYILWLDQIDKNDTEVVGGKSANLGEIKRLGSPVPDGFSLTSEAYYHFLEKNNLKNQIKSILSKIDFKNPDLTNEITSHLKDLIINVDIPAEIISEIQKSLRVLVKKSKYVAVRSSATVEDVAVTSFAGQLESFLNLDTEAEVLEAIKKCWASLYEPRSLFYIKEREIDPTKIGVAVMIQAMIESEVSGVMFTIDPVTNNKSRIVVEAILGLGNLIVKGEVTPDHYEIAKQSFTIINKEIGTQNKQLILSKSENKEILVSPAHRNTQKISDENILELAKIGKRIENSYLFPQDIEWAMENGKIYILQARPVTSIKVVSVKSSKKIGVDLPIIVTGTPASPGIAQGLAKNISSVKQIHKVRQGDILILPVSNQNYIPALKKAAGVVTDKGGETSHAAIVSREVGIPCVVGTGSATKRIKTGSVITINGTLGTVYEGALPYSKLKVIDSSADSYESEKTDSEELKTATDIFVNLVDSSIAAEVSQKNVDGVGLLRAEFIISELGTHPKKLIEDKKEKKFVDQLVNALRVTCASFQPRPVIYRSLDFTSNEYLHLKGGKKYEQEESHPLLGYRGAIRNITDPSIFNLELEAINILRNKFSLRNLWLMLPFIRTIDELANLKRAIAAAGLHQSPTFHLIMSVELPTNVVLIDKYLDVGIDGISIDLSDLTSFMLSIDRSNEKIFDHYSEVDRAVLWSLGYVLERANKRNVYSSVVGQASILNKKIIEKLVEFGVNSVSVSPDIIEKSRTLIHTAEKKLVSSRRNK